MSELIEDFVADGLRHRKWEDWEEWQYCVGDTPYAVSFTVNTRRKRGMDMAWHRKGGDLPGCRCLSGDTCDTDGTSIGAREWYDAQAQEGLVSDAAVFQRLRELYATWRKE